MKIYVNDKFEIKAINSTEDTSLVEIEIDRELAFGNMSDFMVLNYCCKQNMSGYLIYPISNYSDLVEEEYKFKIDELQKKALSLEVENERLEKELSLTQDKLNEILFKTASE